MRCTKGPLAATMAAIVVTIGVSAAGSDRRVPPLAAWPWLPGGIFYTRAGFEGVAFRTRTVRDATVPAGEWLLERPGQEGAIYRVGAVRSVVVPARAEVIGKGTAPSRKLTVAGHDYRYERVLSMMTTAYDGSRGMNGAWGAVAAWNGEPLKRGDVAVDPTVIPLGSYLYVDGYGLARAVDTGSAIVGDHIDLYFPAGPREIARYGIRFRKVYVLGPVAPGSG